MYMPPATPRHIVKIECRYWTMTKRVDKKNETQSGNNWNKLSKLIIKIREHS